MTITQAERARNRKAYDLLDRATAACAQAEFEVARHMLTRDWVKLWQAKPIPRPIAELHGRLWQRLNAAAAEVAAANPPHKG